MRRFLYRPARFKAELPMDFIVGDSVILGTCLNISESGLRGTFADPVRPGAEGLLTLYHGDLSLQAHARIESLQGDESRVHFRFDSDEELQKARDFLKLLPPE